MRDAIIHIRTLPELKAALEERAEAEDRSISRVVELALKQYLQRAA